jgi:hypothetical protein
MGAVTTRIEATPGVPGNTGQAPPALVICFGNLICAYPAREWIAVRWVKMGGCLAKRYSRNRTADGFIKHLIVTHNSRGLHGRPSGQGGLSKARRASEPSSN